MDDLTKSVLITRPFKQARKFQAILGEINSIVLSPIKVSSLKLSEEDQAEVIESCLDGAWSVFTSANSIPAVAPLILGDPPIATVGDETAAALMEVGIRPTFISKIKTGSGMANELAGMLGNRPNINLFQGTSANLEVYNELVKNGFPVKRYVVYEVSPVKFSELPLMDVLNFLYALDENKLVMTFFSGKSLEEFVSLLPEILMLSSKKENLTKIFEEVPTLVIGEKTFEVANSLGFKNLFKPDDKDSASMLSTIKSLVLPN